MQKGSLHFCNVKAEVSASAALYLLKNEKVDFNLTTGRTCVILKNSAISAASADLSASVKSHGLAVDCEMCPRRRTFHLESNGFRNAESLRFTKFFRAPAGLAKVDFIRNI